MRARRTCSCTTATSLARASSLSPRASGSRSRSAKARRAPRRPTWLRSRNPCLSGRGFRAAARFSPSGGGMAVEEKVEFEGEVMEALRGRMFRIQLDNGHEALGYLGGRMKRYRIRLMLGDRVRIELSPYDLTRGRIVYRLG